MVSNIKNIYKDIKREKSSGHMHLAPAARIVNRTNSAHSRTNNQIQNTPGPASSKKVVTQSQANQAQQSQSYKVQGGAVVASTRQEGASGMSGKQAAPGGSSHAENGRRTATQNSNYYLRP